MKISELLQDMRAVGHSKDEHTIDRYKFQDVITSYIKNSFGIAFLIKGKIKPFAFVVMKRELSYNFYNMKQISVSDYFKLFEQVGQENQEVVMVDEEMEKKVKALCLLEELKDKM